MELTEDWPFAAVWLFFCSGALARGGALHWIGRRVRRFDSEHRSLADRPMVRRAEGVVAGMGAPAVTLSFLTVGVQSAVNIASGLLRMPLSRFVPALLLGAMLWATIYTTVGMAVVYAALGRVSWWWLVVAAGAAALIAATTLIGRRRVAEQRLTGAAPPRRTAPEAHRRGRPAGSGNASDPA